jgi:phosphoglycolate phosphatase
MNVLFDLDGTLVDPREGFVASIRHAFIGLDCDPPPDSVIAAHIGPPLGDTLMVLLGTPDPDRIASGIALYREHYSTIGILQNTVYAGIPGALKEIRAGGACLYLATSKPRVFADRILDQNDLRQLFDGVYGSELDGTRSDKRLLIAHILKQEALLAHSTLMVGDRSHDVVGAMANDVRTVGALWGYGSREELTAAGAIWLAENPSRLTSVLSAINL